MSKAFVLLACGVLASAYNYDRCDDLNGPKTGWAALGQCGGLEQSPINLCGAVTFPISGAVSTKKGSKNYTLTAYNYQVKRTVALQNMGHTLQMSLVTTAPTPANSVLPYLQIPALHMLVGRAQADSKVLVDWGFAQMHVHYGREGNANEGSEHAMEGRRFPAEMHLVHYNKARGNNLTAAVATGAKDAVLVIGIFLELGELESALVSTLVKYGNVLPPPPTNTAANAPVPVTLTDLFNSADAFYSYGGSLTTPGCNQQVTWVVMKTPKTITPDSLDLLKKTMETDIEPIALFGNYRYIQPLNGRTVYSSRAMPSVCQVLPVTEPCSVCTPGALTVSSAKTTGQSSDASSSPSTPAWVWICIGVAMPTVILATAFATMYYTSWRRAHPSDKVMLAFTPIDQHQPTIPNSVASC